MDGKEELNSLVTNAKCLLADENSCHTKADKEALLDMVRRAEEALSGRKVPFTRNRAFLNPRPTEEIQFALDHYTMAPTAFTAGKVYGHYGLREAVHWFCLQDMAKWTVLQLESRQQEVLGQIDALLSGAVCGERVGEYNAQTGEILRRQRELLAKAKSRELPQTIARAVDALFAMKFSRKLYSGQNPHPVLLLSEKMRETLIKKIKCAKLVREQFLKIKEIADREGIREAQIAYEQIWEKHSYDELNTEFSIWGDMGRVVNFRTPRGTKGARLSFTLPAIENEEAGLGHIFVTGIRIFAADGPEILVPNAEFAEICVNLTGENVKYWKVIEKGAPICQQRKSKFCPSSLYLCNPTEKDEIRVECEEILPLKEESGYTLFFKAKQDGKFQKGFQAEVEFLDENGSVLGVFHHDYNRKNVLAVGWRALAAQCSALVYWLEGKIEYAQKAKYNMFAFLNDFCQGAEYWMVYNERPEGCDAYGAVQAGRIMCAIASAWSMIASAGVFTKEEKEVFYQMVDYLLSYCLDLRDRVSMSPKRAQEGSSNWQTDMCIGVAALMMVLPDYPQRKTWLYNAEAVLKAQLFVNLNPDGSWPESIRYHHAALEHFATFASILKQETGEDWFTSTRLKDMFAYTLHTITPPYEYFGGRVGTPPFGDHRLSGGEQLGIYGLYLERIAESDEKLADMMYQAWAAAGYPVKNLSSESVAVENLLYAEPEEYSAKKMESLLLKSTGDYPDSGIYVFREKVQGKENYLAVMAAKKPIGHGHLDQGSFILYYHNYPVIMDSGIEGYFDASTQWHLSSYSHACLQFAATGEECQSMRRAERAINLSAGNYSLDRGWLDVPRRSKVEEVSIGKDYDKISLTVAHPAGKEKGIQHRTILFEKAAGIVTVEDRIETYMGNILFSLPMVMKSAVVEENTVYAKGYYPIAMKVEFLSPIESIILEAGRTTPMFPTEEETPMLLYVRAKARAEHGIRVRISVKEQEGGAADHCK